MLPLLIGAAAAPIIGGLVGSLASAGDREKAAKAQADALATIQGLSPPELEKLKADFQQYQLTGEVSPALQSVISQQQSEMKSITTDPRLQQAQLGALQKLQQAGTGGLQPQDLAALAQIQQQAAGMGRAQQASALQDMQQRGQGGSGAELAARLAGAQSAANTSMMGGLNLQGQAAQRALQAIAQSGQLGGQMQAAQFGQEAQIAGAQDAINRFNAANAQQVQGSNVGAQNQAQYYNVGQRQQLANMNTQGTNEKAVRDAQAYQQNYQNQAQKAGATANALNNSANQSTQNAAQTQSTWTGIGQGVGQAAGGVGSYLQKEKSDAAAQANNDKWFDALYPKK